MPEGKKKIFIIEDEATILYGLVAKFNSVDIESEVSDGTEDKINLIERIKTSKADYIILDLILPEIDGFALLADIKSNEDINKIPVFVFTNFSDQDTKIKCENLGVDYYFMKTEFNIDEFVNKVKNITKNLDKKRI